MKKASCLVLITFFIWGFSASAITIRTIKFTLNRIAVYAGAKDAGLGFMTRDIDVKLAFGKPDDKTYRDWIAPGTIISTETYGIRPSHSKEMIGDAFTINVDDYEDKNEYCLMAVEEGVLKDSVIAYVDLENIIAKLQTSPFNKSGALEYSSVLSSSTSTVIVNYTVSTF